MAFFLEPKSNDVAIFYGTSPQNSLVLAYQIRGNFAANMLAPDVSFMRRTYGKSNRLCRKCLAIYEANAVFFDVHKYGVFILIHQASFPAFVQRLIDA